MKTVLKSIVVGLVIFTLSFSPALMGMAQAGGINYEGFSGYKSDNSGLDNGQSRGIMFNFSFGGPDDYKKNSSIQEIYKHNLTTGEKAGIFFGIITVAALVLYINDDDDCVEYPTFLGLNASRSESVICGPISE